MKNHLIFFNSSRGNREKFVEILAESEGEMKVEELVNQVGGSEEKPIPCYVAKISCSENVLEKLKSLTGFCC
jgi:hypothetical protein